jgi:hypothetical protein
MYFFQDGANNGGIGPTEIKIDDSDGANELSTDIFVDASS